MLVSSIKCVPEIHKEGVALPTESILDEGVRELRAMEEVCRRDADRVRAPPFEVRAVWRELVDLLGHGAEERGDTLSRDLLTRLVCRVGVDSHRAEGQKVESDGPLGNAKHGSHWAKGRICRTFSIRNGLEVVVFFLTTMEECTVTNLVGRQHGYVREPNACTGKEGKILRYEGNSIVARP